MNKNLLYLGIVLIIILLGLWGYYFYIQYSGKKPTSTKSGPITKLLPTSTEQIDLSFPDERSLLAYMNVTNRSEEVKAKFREAIEKYAKSGDTVTISKCQASPVALKVKTGQEIKIVNSDDVDYTLRMSGKKEYSLATQQTITLKIDSDSGLSYRCSGNGFIQSAAGYFFVE